ncbi:neuroglobin-like [Chanos chanos]|uniref:Neuroglobin-like n=1 Tax=Chanos chanos TaxID=29144 RepID=A0A6J2VAB8_CHACN|nr:neuroglobin-like [Chanos chanos]
MGCAISGLAPKPVGDPVDEVLTVHLTDEQKERIRDSWKIIQEDISKAGIIMFVRLFESHPECKDVFFEFRNVEDPEMLRTSKELRAHGLRVMSFIEKSVARINQNERLEQLALDLGRKHYRYNSSPKYYAYVGVEFIHAVKPILKESWTPELEEAWKALFLYITRMMKQGYVEEERKQRNAMAEPSKEKPERGLNAI